MNNYQKRKESVRNAAIEWQLNFENYNYSYGELLYYGNRFETLGRRYGLLREFRENGICQIGGIIVNMDKVAIDSKLHAAQVRIDQVAIAVAEDESYRKTAQKLVQISALLDECKKELMNWQH